jgi:hypothetical protein
MEEIIVLPHKTDAPFEQIEHLFEIHTSLLRKRLKQRNRLAFNKFLKFLETGGTELGYKHPDKFYPGTYITSLTSIKFKDYLLLQSISLEYANNLLSYANKFIEFIASNGFANDPAIIYANISFEVIGSNGKYDSYSDGEVAAIKDALNIEGKFITRLIHFPNYKKTGRGISPFEKHYPDGRKSNGFSDIDNCIFYFENMLECCPIPATNENQKVHRRFFYSVCNRPGGLAKFYHDLGVTDFIGVNIVGALLMRLAIETGLNPCSLFSLKVDCLTENNLITGSPSIEITKYRSGGNRTLHISVNDSSQEIFDLKQKEFQIIKKIIEAVKTLTARFRDRAPEDISDRLFIYESRSTRKFSEIVQFSEHSNSRFCQYLVNKYALTDSDGKRLELKFVRFRPTRLSKMFLENRDEFEIQATAIHGSVLETLKYARRKNLEIHLIKKDKLVLQSIYSSFSKSKKSEDADLGQPPVYSGIICDCKNIYDPPEEVKRLKSYKEGQSCSWFNMCLLCKNVIITKHHLPILFNYRKQILLSSSYSKEELPLPHIYDRMLLILNSILDDDSSKIDKQDLEWAKRIAERDSAQFIDPSINIPSNV